MLSGVRAAETGGSEPRGRLWLERVRLLVRWGAEARDAEARGSMHRAKSSSPRLRIAAIYCNVISNFTNIFVSAVSPWVDGSAPQKWVIRRCETET